MLDRHPGLILSRHVRERGEWPREFSARTGIPFTDLMELYRAERAPTPSERRIIADALGCTPFALKRLYAGFLGEFIDECAHPRLVEPLPWELCRLEPERCDAVVMVHPDWDPVGPDRDTLRRLADAFARLRTAGKPLFILRASREPVASLEELHRDFGAYDVDLGAGSYRHPRDRRHRSRQQVWIVADLLGREPQALRLAFGGQIADACVQAHAFRWCHRVWTRWLDPDFLPSPAERSRMVFRRGELVDELLILSGDERRFGGLSDGADIGEVSTQRACTQSISSEKAPASLSASRNPI